MTRASLAAGSSRDQRRASAATAGHLVAVDAGDDGRGLARQVDQDRGGRAAVLRAVEDAGEHDQARRRLEMERQRQQHRDGRNGTDAGQHADQGSDQRAGERKEHVRRRQRYPETDHEIVQKLHSPLATMPARPGS